jgi:hypothetical protein
MTTRRLLPLLLVTATVLNYLIWLGWDQHRDIDPVTGAVTGPYEAWQVICAGAVLLPLALLARWQRRVRLAAVVIPATFTACWTVDAATGQSPDANLWPIGAALLAAGSALGVALFARLGVAARSWHIQPAS